ncbi:Dak phosphatase [Athelia psychrophila]|uniref:Dak phosphatase n=1 Tax=Athelia psychrophila TaxID=1759441 RepID=A0A167TLC4_9AGAM|nr:Dak phosphatase [Fibularhizoctonia sp. CBS 109695]
MGGTSGALYSIFFSALAQGIEAAPVGDEKIMWSSALQYALEKLYTYTRARRPSRTLVDPLAAFVEKIQEKQENSFALSVKAAQSAAEGTRDLAAKAGRSAYVGADSLRDERVADPGAWGVKVILEGLLG